MGDAFDGVGPGPWVDVDEGAGGDELHPQRRRAAMKRADSRRRRRLTGRSVVEAQPVLEPGSRQSAILAKRVCYGGLPWSALPRR
jgi:hypothetical protein